MLSKAQFGYIVLSILSASHQVLAREQWLERDNRPVYLYPRRFGQEQPAVIQKLSAACPGQICGNLAGQAVTPLLAAQPECSQQDHADAIIDASRQFDAATQANMIALAIEYRQAEKNTPPDFSTNPPSLRNSVFCQKAPKNAELNGLVQAQDPANDPNLFFDPALKATVQKGSQANTAPFGGALAAPPVANPSSEAPAATTTATPERAVVATSCVTAITITVTGTNPAATGGITISVGDLDPIATAAPVPTGAAPPVNGNIGDFGKCSVPQMEFGVGFDNRKETSFRPVDRVSYNHGSAQNHAIITQFICDTLVNSCGADKTAQATCATAKTAAAAAAAGTGAQADAFNAVFGISTNFASVASVDNQGRIVPGTGSGTGAAPSSITAAPTTATTPAPAATSSPSTGGNAGVDSFGSCSVPQIEFAAGLDGRRETSFQPSDKSSFSQGSAQNIAIITRAICDALTNVCGANQAAKNTCAEATAAANAAPAGGAQADAFNHVFGIQTNFAAVTQLDDQGRVIGGTPENKGGGAEVAQPQPPNFVAPTSTAARQAVTSVTPLSIATSTPAAKIPANTNNLQTFTNSLGGVGAPAVTPTADGKFQVEGNSIINDAESALLRSCDVQNNKCADAANQSGNKNGFTVAACTAQQQQCAASVRG